MAEKLNKEAFIANINECFNLLQTYEECYKEILDIIDVLNNSDVTIETLQGLIEGSKYISFDVNEEGTKLIINLDRTHIDTKPVYQSENLITSGGVASLYSANIDWTGDHTYDGHNYTYIDTCIDFSGNQNYFTFVGRDFSLSAPFTLEGQCDITGNTTIEGEFHVKNDTFIVNDEIYLNGETYCSSLLDVEGSISSIGPTAIYNNNSNTAFLDLHFNQGYQLQLPIFNLTYNSSGTEKTEYYRVLGHNAQGNRILISNADINREKGLEWNGTQLEITHNVVPLTQEDYDNKLQEGTIDKDTLYVIGEF